MRTLEGQYFFPRASRFVAARAEVRDRAIRVMAGDGAALDEAPVRAVRASHRLGHLVRRIGFPSGGRFESADNDFVDDFLREAGARVRGATIDRVERSWIAAFIAITLAVATVYAFIMFGIPATASALAEATPDSANTIIAEQTMQILDGGYLKPSRLPPEAIAKAQELFARATRHARRGPQGYRLVIRQGNFIGPNAFALPDGTIIMTDEMWGIAKSEDEIVGVFAHEISHVDRRHILQMLYQAALIPAAIAVVTGDVSQVAQIATLLPGLLVQASYARGFEQQADDDAARFLRQSGGDPAALADLLKRMEAIHCGDYCMPSWLGSHPDTRTRMERLRNTPRLPGDPPTAPSKLLPELPPTTDDVRK